ncbi:MAG: PHP domain-containing protein [Candidatus Omnitrophica bacterium]|nr:PHP domain-containing protein [Candidatus Omnitrophota bacterium]
MNSEEKYADLHLHTNFSDGSYTVEELIAQSLKNNLSVISITDHDTVDGIKPAMEVAEGFLEVLSGIELSAEYGGKELHILGYLIDYENEELKNKLEVLKNNRIKRIYTITDKLKKLGVDLNPQTVFSLGGAGTVGRLHIAQALLKEGKVASIQEAFYKFIADNRPAYVAGFKFSPEEAIKTIKNAGGIPVLAHPYTINDEELILGLTGCGLMGLEVYYPEHSQSMVNFYSRFCEKYGLLMTGGSDSHGSLKPEITVGCIKIPYELVEKLKQAK